MFGIQVTCLATWAFSPAAGTRACVANYIAKVTPGLLDVTQIDVLCHQDLYLYVTAHSASVRLDVIPYKRIPTRIQLDKLLATEVIGFTAVARHHQCHVMRVIVAVKIAEIQVRKFVEHVPCRYMDATFTELRKQRGLPGRFVDHDAEVETVEFSVDGGCRIAIVVLAVFCHPTMLPQKDVLEICPLLVTVEPAYLFHSGSP